MALKQELLVNNASDLHGPTQILAEYDDVSLKIFRFIVKGKESNRKVSINIKTELSTVKFEAKNEYKDFDVATNNMHFVESKEGGFEFEKGFKIVFSSGGIGK